MDFVDSPGKPWLSNKPLLSRFTDRNTYLKTDLPEDTVNGLRAAPLGQATLFGAVLVNLP